MSSSATRNIFRLGLFVKAGSGSHLVPVARKHPQGHGVGPSRRCTDIVSLCFGAVEAVDLHHHLRHQPVMETGDPQKGLLLIHSVADK